MPRLLAPNLSDKESAISSFPYWDRAASVATVLRDVEFSKEIGWRIPSLSERKLLGRRSSINLVMRTHRLIIGRRLMRSKFLGGWQRKSRSLKILLWIRTVRSILRITFLRFPLIVRELCALRLRNAQNSVLNDMHRLIAAILRQYAYLWLH
jgi:hypothetical protein